MIGEARYNKITTLITFLRLLKGVDWGRSRYSGAFKTDLYFLDIFISHYGVFKALIDLLVNSAAFNYVTTHNENECYVIHIQITEQDYNKFFG